MAFGPVGSSVLLTVDSTAPGAPSVSASQSGKNVVSWSVIAPSNDSDGSPLSGLTFAEVCMVEGTEADVPSLVADFDSAKLLPGAQNTSYDIAGPAAVQTGTFPSTDGKSYVVLARCADHARA